jgi:hypothetical protein
MKPVFTKSFFRLSDSDQAAVVRAIIHDLESCVGRHIDPADDKTAEQRIKRIRARAIQHGVFQDDVLNTACFAKLVMQGGEQ